MIAVALLGVLVLAAWAFVPKPVGVDVATAVRGPLTVSLLEDGITRVRERFDVTAPVTGRLMRVIVHPGDEIRAGMPLARIEPALLDSKSEAQLRAQLREAERTAQASDALLRRAGDAAVRAASEASRIRKLAQQSVVSRDQFEAATTAESMARKDREAAAFQAAASLNEIEAVRAALGAFDPHGVPAEIVVRAPVDGRILQVTRESESVVTPGLPIITIGDPALLEIVADFLTTDAVKIHTGDRLLVEHWGGLQPLEARVRVVGPSAFTKISALGVEEQRVNVIADFVQPPPALGDQYRIDARVIAWQGDALKVPATAVFSLHGAWNLFAVRNGRARLQRVEVGHIGESEIEITRGLVAGDVIISHPSDQVREGLRVRANG
jgi:HlyD family secretion protein